ncbi:hypothetical protein SS50377_20822 [Spironucleus salmonicida]|uniref:Uncharacterized protein n=1 Tax=Spironucleus salmonicida TaxID=348837 RepID=V6LG62_9EUKA|nr:hypothetical protein SS50377_20822 [Spironucleus salmonicida]|eukprot:EST43512.1 Hypothetical protein SS50377_16546 [Spironucleus salmonicida]
MVTFAIMRRILKAKKLYEIDIIPQFEKQNKQYLQYKSFNNQKINHSIPSYKFHENEEDLTVVYPNNEKTVQYFESEKQKLLKQQSEDIYREQLRKLDEQFVHRVQYNLKLSKETFSRNQIFYQSLRINRFVEKQNPLKGCIQFKIIEDSVQKMEEQ